MKGMAEFPDKFFSLAIVDPPYEIDWHGTGFKKQTHLYEKHKKELDKWDKKPDKKYWIELKRISKNQIIWGINYFSEHYGNFTPIVWDKKNGNSMMADGELAGTSIKTSLKIFRHAYIGKYHYEERTHPTQKPIQLYKWLLRNYAKPTDKIISTHVGSGSDIIAFIDFGCEYIGFEIDRDYYESAIKRIEQHKSQFVLNLKQ